MNPDQSLWTEASTASVTRTVAGSYEGSHYKKKIDAKWSSASSAGQKILPPMSKDDKLRAMLGHKQLESGALNPIFWREDFCGVCGCQHINPAVLDTYPNCERCQNPLRLSRLLRKRYEDLYPVQPLELLFVSYGGQITEKNAVDVTQQCKDIMAGKNSEDRFGFGPSTNLQQVFDLNPSPNKPKQLRVRYRMDGIFGMIIIDTMSNSRMISKTAMVLKSPKLKRMLKIKRAYYGHPKGTSSTGRMSYEVTEFIQGLVDLRGGSHLILSEKTPLTPFFGDPCPGYPKELRIEFEILGNHGSEVRSESQNHLIKDIIIESSPVISPIVFIVSATYGMTALTRNDRLLAINKILATIEATEKRMDSGAIVSKEDRKILRSKRSLLGEKVALRNTPISSIDVSEKMQMLVAEGGMSIVLDKLSFDPNREFGDPFSPQFLPPESDVNANMTMLGHTNNNTNINNMNNMNNMLGYNSNNSNNMLGNSNNNGPGNNMNNNMLGSNSNDINNMKMFGMSGMSGSSSVGGNNSNNNNNRNRNNGIINHNNNNNNNMINGMSNDMTIGINEGSVITRYSEGDYSAYPTSRVKLLSVVLISQGHDSERLTSNVETTSAGNPLNYIRSCNATYLIPTIIVDGEERLSESLVFHSKNVSPIIRVDKASYGNLSDMSKIVDVTTETQTMVTGRTLVINKTLPLSDTFSCDPCPGQQKQLRVDYRVLGFQGNLRIKCMIKTDCLAAPLELGFPPTNPPDT